VFLYGFDLIELDGEDLRPAALELRKSKLEKLLAQSDGFDSPSISTATSRSSSRTHASLALRASSRSGATCPTVPADAPLGAWRQSS
jgi:ATP-dependent DNA ligase